MHFEVPKSKTLKEFGGEYVMIVISILTALALEHAVQTLHHRHLAHEASTKIEAELRANAREIGQVLEHNRKDVKEVERVRAELLQGIRDKVPDGMLMARFDSDWQAGLVLGISVPSLRHEAWDAALANQAVTWMQDEQLQRYATAYANMRDVHDLTTNGNMAFLDGPRRVDVMSDLKMGTATPQQMFKALSQVRNAYASVDGNLEGLLKQLPKADAAAGAAH